MIFSVYYIDKNGKREKVLNLNGVNIDELIDNLVLSGYEYVDSEKFFEENKNQTYTWERLGE